MADLPQKFLHVMKVMLGEEFDAFLESYDEGRQFGLRVNTAKLTTEEFERIAPFHLSQIPWTTNGYFYEEEDFPARHPFYGAGLYYLQEPSAMTPASRLPINPGDKVLDLCAAPGGKATALGARLRGEGMLVANDINTARGKALLRNIELFGIPNAFITNEPPYKLAEKFPAYFDKIMVDAPCSGEGMFRKNPSAVDNWLEKGPEYFSKLQHEIVEYAADMLKADGYLFYSTCTFSPLENEGTISHLLRVRPEMEVVLMEDYEGFSRGFTREAFQDLWGEYPELAQISDDCAMTRRIWPHRLHGEGHFLALLHKKATARTVPMDDSAEGPIANDTRRKKAKGKKGQKVKSAMDLLDRDQKQALSEFFADVRWDGIMDHLDIRGEKVYYVPDRYYENLGIHFLRNGIYLGDLKKKRFEPSEPFALSLSKDSYANTIDFARGDERLRAYQRGEQLDVTDWVERAKKEGRKIQNGWYLLLVEGYPLGFGKLAGNILKNKYPVGWRL